jgi:hypothetical protein
MLAESLLGLIDADDFYLHFEVYLVQWHGRLISDMAISIRYLMTVGT